MAEQKKMVEEITSMEVDFAQWYTDIVKKADLIDYSSVKGCMVIRPYGYAVWENIQKILDGCRNSDCTDTKYNILLKCKLPWMNTDIGFSTLQKKKNKEVLKSAEGRKL